MRRIICVLYLMAAGTVPVWSNPDPGLFRANFDNLDGWKNDSAKGSPPSYRCTNGVLRISSRANTRDRVKVRTNRRFGAGTFSWRVYAPTMGQGDQASIGAFLYNDDRHEIDFEIGYGNAKMRKQLKAKETDLVCYCTSQGHPYGSSQILLKKEAWHVLSIDIAHGKNGKYLITWLVNGVQVKRLQTSYGDEVMFTAHCSVENLLFIGDHIPAKDHYALFDYVEIKPAARNKPDDQPAG